MLVLNHRTAPHCPTIWAVRMSMSIPFVWQEVQWSPSWGTYRGRHIAGHTIVDGGVLSNFPINLLVSDSTETRALMGDPQTPAQTLGLLIDESLPVADASAREDIPDPKKPVVDLESRWFITLHRITHLVDTMMKSHDNTAMIDHKDLICRLPAQGYGTTEFDMSDARVAALVAAGRAAMESYFNPRSARGSHPRTIDR